MTMKPSAGGKGGWILGLLFLVPFCLFGLGIIKAVHFVGALVFVLYLSLLVVNFEAGFLALIFIRSSIDCLKSVSSESAAGGGAGPLAAGISVALIVLGVFYVLYRKVNIFTYRESGPFLLFLIFCGISIANSQDLLGSVSDWLRLLSVFSAYLLTRIIFVTQKKIRLLVIVSLLSAVAPILAAFFQLITGRGTILDAGQHRIIGTFLHPNAFASYLMILLIFCGALILEMTDFISRRFLMFLAGSAFVIFIFTYSRGAWIAFIFAMLLVGFLRYRKILGVLPFVLLLAVLLVPAIKDRIINIFNAGYTHGRSGWEWRLQIWSEILPMVAAKPLFGYGLYAVKTELGVLAHNDYLRLIVETGVFGFLSYLYLAYILLRQTWQDFQNAHSGLVKCFQVGLFAMVAGFLLRETADNTIRNNVTMLYFWIFVGLTRNMALLSPKREAA